MTAFTDDDLKRLKDEKDFLIYHRWIVPALLARLEAAEKYIEIVAGEEPLGAFDTEAYEAWRKAAGKDK